MEINNLKLTTFEIITNKKELEGFYKDGWSIYGLPIDFVFQQLIKGDIVEYTKTLRYTEGPKKGKTYKTYVYGIWDGEKVEFNDKEQTIVRNPWWLDKII